MFRVAVSALSFQGALHAGVGNDVAIDVNIVRITVQITAQPWAPRTH